MHGLLRQTKAERPLFHRWRFANVRSVGEQFRVVSDMQTSVGGSCPTGVRRSRRSVQRMRGSTRFTHETHMLQHRTACCNTGQQVATQDSRLQHGTRSCALAVLQHTATQHTPSERRPLPDDQAHGLVCTNCAPAPCVYCTLYVRAHARTHRRTCCNKTRMLCFPGALKVPEAGATRSGRARR